MTEEKELYELDHQTLMEKMEEHLRKNGSYAVQHVEEIIRRLEGHEDIAAANRANPEPAKGAGKFAKAKAK